MKKMWLAIGEPNNAGSRGQISARDALKPLAICLYYLRSRNPHCCVASQRETPSILPSADPNLLRGNCAASAGVMCEGDFVPDHRGHIKICQDDTVHKRPAHSVRRRRGSILLWLLLLAVLLSAELCSCEKADAPAPSEPQPSVAEPSESAPSPEPTEPVPTEPEVSKTSVKMSFVGDCLIGSDFGGHGAGSYNNFADSNDPSYFFSGVTEIFAADDITVVDCETVLTDRGLAQIEKEEDPGYWYYGPASNAAALAAGSVEIASTANNHTGDYGVEGFRDTVAAIEAAGVQAGLDLEPIYYDANGVRVGVLCCNCWSSYHATRILRVLAEMNECSDIQVIFPHGGSMNTYVPDEWRVDAYRSFIDAGAEVVAAGHPHKLQPLERYHDGVIVYSLGNFCYGGSTRPENATVILSVTANFTDGIYQSLDCELYPCYLYTTPRNNYHPELIPPADPAYNRILDFMFGLRDSPLE